MMEQGQRRGRCLTILGAALLGLAAAVCPGGLPAKAQATTASVWIFPRAALTYAAKHDPGLYSDLVSQGSGQTVYQLLNPGSCSKFPSNYPAIKGASPPLFDTEHYYNGYKVTASAFKPRSGTRTVLLDQELYQKNWPCTSSQDESDPVLYDHSLASVVRNYKPRATSPSLTFATAPALDLFCNPTSKSCLKCPADTYGQPCTPCVPSKADTDYSCYLKYHIAGMEAVNADVIDIQAQSLENSQTRYDKFVGTAVRQAHAANPSVTVLVGLTDDCKSCTGPNAAAFAATLAGELSTAVNDGASGAWINEDSGGNAALMDKVVCSEISHCTSG